MKGLHKNRCRIVNHKRRYLCDYHGECKNLAYREVYPGMLKNKNKDAGWSYLCRNHFNQEHSKFKGKLPYCTLD